MRMRNAGRRIARNRAVVAVAGAAMVATTTGAQAMPGTGLAGALADSAVAGGAAAEVAEAVNSYSADPASVTMDSDFDVILRTVERFVVAAPGGAVFDGSAARAAGASDAVLRIGESLTQFSAGFDDSSIMFGPNSVGYGRWCGPGHSGPGESYNLLDSLCMRHDKCYDARGYFSCSCDRDLVADIKANRDRFATPSEQAMAFAVATFFSLGLCNQLT